MFPPRGLGLSLSNTLAQCQEENFEEYKSNESGHELRRCWLDTWHAWTHSADYSPGLLYELPIRLEIEHAEQNTHNLATFRAVTTRKEIIR